MHYTISMSYIGIVGDYIKRKIEEGKVVIEVKSKNLLLRARLLLS